MDRLTTQEHWDAAWTSPPRWRLPSPFVVGTRNIQRIMKRHVRPGMRVLELGCAPGKILAWVAAVLGAEARGVDYSERGIAWARQVFQSIGLTADLRCEDVFHTSFPSGSHDLVYSWGLVEHFADPRPMIRAHVELLKPGGKAVIGIPDYGGIYGRFQGWFDPQNLAMHNVSIMTPETFSAQAPADLADHIVAYRAGRFSPWLISFDRRLPRPVAFVANHTLNLAGLLQPADIAPISPLLVLEMTRRHSGTAW